MSAGENSAGSWLDFDRDGSDWPGRENSHFIEAAGLRWHVQISGKESAPTVLLLHGTGASSHSWADAGAILSDQYRVIIPDLPCHGFTQPITSSDLSLDGMAYSLVSLIKALEIRPSVIVGHSAGAAIAVRLATGDKALVGGIEHVIGINGAYLPIRGNRIFSPMAKALFANPYSAAMFSALTKYTPLGGNLLEATGSTVDDKGRGLYRRLMGSPGHVRGALGMMASWDLVPFDGYLQRLKVPLTLIANRDDRMVPFDNSDHAARVAPQGRLISIPTGGHLWHEAAPQAAADEITRAISGNSASSKSKPSEDAA